MKNISNLREKGNFLLDARKLRKALKIKKLFGIIVNGTHFEYRDFHFYIFP